MGMNTVASSIRLGINARWVVPALLACYLVWGSTYLAIRFALVSFPPYFQMGSRFVVAGALLLVWMRWRGTAWPTALQWRNTAVAGCLMLAAAMGWPVRSKRLALGLLLRLLPRCPS